VPVPKDKPDRFEKRHDWLTGPAREKWVAWRCDAMTALHREVLARLRQVRPDLKLYLTPAGQEAGIDAKKLSAIEGVVLMDAPSRYGRRDFTDKGALSDQANRDGLLDPASLGKLRTITGRSALKPGIRGQALSLDGKGARIAVEGDRTLPGRRKGPGGRAEERDRRCGDGDAGRLERVGRPAERPCARPLQGGDRRADVLDPGADPRGDRLGASGTVGWQEKPAFPMKAIA